MPRRDAIARRSAGEWGVRALLAAIAAAVGYNSVSYTLGDALQSDPVRSHVLAPRDGRITARLAETFLTAKARAADRDQAEHLAKLALEQDPTAVRAVGLLGLLAQLRGDTSGARRLMTYSESLSRRDLQTQLWAIEDAVARNDIAGALRHYDVALRTVRAAPDLLFPVLSTAIADPAIRAGLKQTLARKPAWGPSFITYAAANADPGAAVSLFRELRPVGVAVADDARASVIKRMIADGHFEEAWIYYSTSVTPSADRRRSRDPQFAAASQPPTQFDWTPINSVDIRADIDPAGHDGRFDFSAPPSAGGDVLQQAQMLPPGKYRVEGRSIGIDLPKSSQPYWVLRCQDGRELGRVAVPNSAEAAGKFSGEFSVAPGCPIQTFALVVQPSDSVSGISGQIDQVRLYPVP